MKTPTRRLTIPAPRTPSREALRPVMPFFLRDLGAEPSLAGPPLLCFASDSFVDDFLAVAGQRRALPKTLPWRDWSEPPDAMLDPSGNPDYPATISRAVPFAFVPEAVGAGIDPDGIPSGTPTWLRKLYLPLHERFTLVAFDLVCRAAGWPRLDRPRVLEAGAVIRRLVPDPAAERWEDWIPIDEKRGLWLEILDGTMAPRGGGAPADPVALPPSATLAHEARLRALLELAADAPLGPLGLTSQPLNLVPLDTGDSGRHCTLFGYLPVFSAAQSVPETDLDGKSQTQLIEALRDRVRDGITAAFAAEPTLQGRIHAQLRTLLDDAALPSDATTDKAHDARQAIVTRVLNGATIAVSTDLLWEAIDWLVEQAASHAIVRCWSHAADRNTLSAAADGASADGQAHWVAAGAPMVVLTAPSMPTRTQIGQQFPGLNTLASVMIGDDFSGRLASTYASDTSAWDRLVRVRLHRLMGAWLATGSIVHTLSGFPAGLERGHVDALLGLTVLRLRNDRLALAAYLNRIVSPDVRIRYWDLEADRPAFAAVDLAPLIQETDALESVRGNTLGLSEPPWPPVTDAGLADALRLRRVHDAGLALEGLFSKLTGNLLSAGSAAEFEIDLRRRAAEQRIAAVLSHSGEPPDILSSYTLQAHRQPALGILTIPGVAFSDIQIQALAAAAAAHYGVHPNSLIERDKRGARGPRLRFDADHIYAVWCWTRVAGRDPCEPERLVWTPRGEPFLIADPTDLLGARPVSIKMPDIPKLLRDIPRLSKARAHPFAAVVAPQNSGIATGEDMADTRRDWGIGFICSFGIPVITICALVLFNIIFHILIVLPGFAWMLLLKFCIPFPRRGS